MLSKNLKTLRKSRNWTQQYVAEKLGISRACWEHWESGRTEPNLNYLIKIADMFNCDVFTLKERSASNDPLVNDNDAVLFTHIMNLSNNEIEQELLIKCTLLDNRNQEKILEIVNMFLREQGDYYIKDQNGKWVELSQDK